MTIQFELAVIFAYIDDVKKELFEAKTDKDIALYRELLERAYNYLDRIEVGKLEIE